MPTPTTPAASRCASPWTASSRASRPPPAWPGRLSAWFRQSSGGAPAAIGDAYALDGQHAWDEPDSTMAFVAPLAVAAMLDPAEAEWRDALWAEVVERPLDAELYYGNTLKMLALIALSGNWFPPE